MSNLGLHPALSSLVAFVILPLVGSMRPDGDASPVRTAATGVGTVGEAPEAGAGPPRELAYDGALWPASGIVEYVFDPAISAADRAFVRKCMAEIEGVCGVSFVPETSPDPDHLHIEYAHYEPYYVNYAYCNANYCTTHRWATPVQYRVLRIPGNAAQVHPKYRVCHSLIHHFGFIHEEQRVDRGAYVTINLANVTHSSTTVYFPPCSPCSVTTYPTDIIAGSTPSGPYDFLSIMHSSQYEWSFVCGDVSLAPAATPTPSLRTIICNPGYTQYQDLMGNRTYMTLLDAQGLADRLGTPPAPQVTGVSPGEVFLGAGPATLLVSGTRFYEGSPNSLGVQGSGAFWNGVPVSTTYVDETTLQVVVPESLIAALGYATLTVENPSPGGGTSNAYGVFVQCSLPTPLVNATPQSITVACQGFSLTPVPGIWNVVGVASTSNFDVILGAASSTLSGGSLDFLLANGNLGSIAGGPGVFNRVSGTAGATGFHRSATTVALGSSYDSTLAAGHPFRALQVDIPAAGSYTVTLTGDSSLLWRIFDPGSGPQWRSRSTSSAVGWVSAGPVTVNLSAGLHGIVVYKNDAPPATGLTYSLSVCPSVPVVQLPLGSTGIPQPCQTFSLTPTNGKWNGVAVATASTSDWDIAITETESEYGAGVVDFLLANGHLGVVAPTVGTFNRESGSASATAVRLDGVPITIGGAPVGAFWGSTDRFALFEFQVAQTGCYDITVANVVGTGIENLAWLLFRPGTNANWVARSSLIGAGTANGQPGTVSLSPGWHALAVVKDVSATAQGSYEVAVGATMNAVPVLTALGPPSSTAGGPAFTLTASGSGFRCGSTVRWNGANLTTTFASPTQLTASVGASLIAAPGSASISVFNPGTGGGTSNTVSHTIAYPVPVLNSISPTSAAAGSPQLFVICQGSGFFSGSRVRWNGSDLPTLFVNPGQLTASLFASNMVSGGISNVTVFNPAPGGGSSAARTFTVNNPVPVLGSISPASVPVGQPGTTITCIGSGFVPTSRGYFNGINLGTVTYVGPTQVRLSVPAPYLQLAGTVNITVDNPAPMGGTSGPQTFTIESPAPVLTSISPSAAIAGSPGFTILAGGSGFQPNSQIRWNGTSLASTFLNPLSQALTAPVPPALLSAPGTALISVFTPPPGGGTSAELTFSVPGPVITALTPATIPVLTAASPPFSLTVDGLNFLPSVSRVSANGVMQSASPGTPTQIQVLIDPAAVLQATLPGAIAINVENTVTAVSNTVALVVGSGSNLGTIRRQPLNPAPGQAYAGVLEGGHPNAVFTMVADFNNPPPVTAWPDAQVNLVLSVATAGPPVPIVDGFGLFSPATGATLDGNGGFVAAGFSLPSPPLGLSNTTQAVYADPTAPIGFRLTWARYPGNL